MQLDAFRRSEVYNRKPQQTVIRYEDTIMAINERVKDFFSDHDHFGAIFFIICATACSKPSQMTMGLSPFSQYKLTFLSSGNNSGK